MKTRKRNGGTAAAAGAPRRGRQPKPAAEVLKPQGTFRSTDEHFGRIKEAARKKGLDPMTYARMRTLEAADHDLSGPPAGPKREGGGS